MKKQPCKRQPVPKDTLTVGMLEAQTEEQKKTIQDLKLQRDRLQAQQQAATTEVHRLRSLLQKQRRTIVGTACILVYQRYLQLKEKKAVGKGYNKENLVFCTSTGKPAPPRSFTRNFQGALKHAGLERMRFHDMRHTVATVLLEEGAALNTVQELLGHYDPKFTATQYGHVTTRMRTEATDKLSGLLTAAKRVGQHDTKKS